LNISYLMILMYTVVCLWVKKAVDYGLNRAPDSDGHQTIYKVMSFIKSLICCLHFIGGNKTH